jgi:hypothetical protein
MKKPKATSKAVVRLKNQEIKRLEEEDLAYRAKVRAYVLEIGNVSNKRRLMSIESSNNKGLINCLTIPVFVMLVNLCDGTGKTIVLETENNKKDLLVVAKKKLPRTPYELL